jgi:hypothetical protein
VSRTGAPHYLPALLAEAFRTATGADAGLVPASQHTTQGAVDGAVAALSVGPVTVLDLYRLFGQSDDRLAVVRLGPGEFTTVRRALDEVADPLSTHADDVWWNWCRMPNGVSTTRDDPATVALLPHVAPRLAELLGRDVEPEPVAIGARQALLAALPH